MTSFDINDSVVFVTGTNKRNGIGRAIVAELISRGAKKVYATARSIEQLLELEAEFPDRVVPVALDVTNDEAVSQLGEKYADVNLLINNAGVMTGSLALQDGKQAALEIAVNYLAPMHITQSFQSVLEAQAKRGQSALVNINSIASLINFSLGGTYSASKAASHSLTQAQRRELPSSLVIGVYPGPIETDMSKGVPMAKANPQVVARAIADALSQGQEDVFPDPTAQQLFEGWKQDAKAIERQMAGGSVAE